MTRVKVRHPRRVEAARLANAHVGRGRDGSVKPKRYAKRVAWAGNARQLGRRWRSYLGLAGGAAMFVSFFALWPHMPLRAGLIGFTLGAATAMAALSLVRFDDPQVRGDLAEQWSAEAFGKVRGWQIINGLTFTDGDLDHVVVTPSGVLAVETKYRFQQPDKQRLAAQRRKDLDSAKRAARKTASLLRSKDVGRSAAVMPVLVVWGKGTPDLPHGFTQVDGAYVLDGDHPGLWSHLFNAPLLDPDSRKSIHEALADYQRKQTAWASGHQESLRALCWKEFRAGVVEANQDRKQRLLKRRALRRRHQIHQNRRDPVSASE